jgi:hypothetical protein
MQKLRITWKNLSRKSTTRLDANWAYPELNSETLWLEVICSILCNQSRPTYSYVILKVK